MSQQSISIISFGRFEKSFLDRIATHVQQEVEITTRIKEGHIDLSEYYDPTRRQYNANKLLKDVETMYSFDSLKTIGIFNVDLFIPILTYIFGQAFLNGKTGIVSAYRLINEKYGIFSDDKVLIERLIKEVTHELGHTFGLIHCHTPTCVMRSSTYVEDLDQKRSNYCNNCKTEIIKYINTLDNN